MDFQLNSHLQTIKTWAYRLRHKLATGGLALLACLLAYHVVFGANGLLVYRQKQKEYRQLQEQNRTLQQQNENLEGQNKALKNDPQAIEKEAREQLHYARPGEVVYTTSPKPASPAPGRK
jgi:cell division protein FtsB